MVFLVGGLSHSLLSLFLKLYQKTSRHHEQFQQSSRIKKSIYKNKFTKSIAFLYTNNEQIKREYRKIIPFMTASNISLLMTFQESPNLYQ
jgi:hypothetical protein